MERALSCKKILGNLHTRDKTSRFSGVSQNPGHRHITEKHVERASPRSVEKPGQHVLQWDKTVFESQRHERGKILLNRIGNAKRRNRESVRKENSLSTKYRPPPPSLLTHDLGHPTANVQDLISAMLPQNSTQGRGCPFSPPTHPSPHHPPVR